MISSIKSGSTGAITGDAHRPTKSAIGKPSSSGSGSGERVQLSQLAMRLQAMETSMAQTPVVDSARVSEIRRAIAEGSFKVNPNVVADSLIQTARELMQARYA